MNPKTVPDYLSTLGAEETFLLHSLRRFVNPGKARSTPVRPVNNWRRVFDLASDHGVLPVVSDVIRREYSDLIPNSFANELEDEARSRARYNLRLTGELLRVLDLLGDHRISGVAFKGPVLAASLYGDLGLREFSDIDILIRREDVSKVRHILVAEGYRTDLPENRSQEAAYLRTRHELHFTSKSGASIEVHQAFLAPFFSVRFDYKAIFERLERQDFCGRNVLTLRSDDLLMALCGHGTKHCWSRLTWILDIAKLVTDPKQNLDWTRVSQYAMSLGASRMVSLGLVLARRILGAPIPEELAGQQDGTLTRLASDVEQSVPSPLRSMNELHGHRFYLNARERLRDRVAYCAHLALTPNEEDHSVLPLPGPLSPLYYPLHLARVAGKFALASAKSHF